MVFWLLTKKKSQRISVEPGLNSVKVSYAPGCTWEVATFKNNYKEKIKIVNLTRLIYLLYTEKLSNNVTKQALYSRWRLK